MSARRSRIRDTIVYVAFRLVVAVFSALPLGLAAGLSGWFWRTIAPTLPRHRRALDHLLVAFPQASLLERERIARAMWENLGRTFAEFFHIERILREKRIDMVPAETWKAAAASGPFVICGLHLSNWELLAPACVGIGIPVVGVYQRVSNPLVNRWIYERRRPYYPGGLFDKSHETARTMLKAAKSGACPSFLADLREGKGIQTPFFGRPAWSNPFPVTVARTQNLPIYAIGLIRKPGERFELRIAPVEVPHTSDRRADVRVGALHLQSQFEKFVREAPEQWTWAHRRWD